LIDFCIFCTIVQEELFYTYMTKMSTSPK